MSENYKIINGLIKSKKIKFDYYKNSQIPLELIEICDNKVDDVVELKFRNIMQDYLDEIKKIVNINK